MNKDEYLHRLEACLKKHLPKAEVSDIIRDYGEYFEDGRRQNKSDTEISAKLGSPEIIAQQFIDEYQEDKKDKAAEELLKIKEKASSGIHSAKGKLSEVHVVGGIGSLLGGLGRLVGNAILFFIRLGILGFALFFGAILEFAFLGFLFGIAAAVVGCVVASVCGVVFSIVSLGFISLFFTIGGILGSIAVFCFGALLALGAFFVAKLNICFIWDLVLKVVRKQDSKEAA